MLALTPATAKHNCKGCHDNWNRSPTAPRDTKPKRCPCCPINQLLPALDPKKISSYGGGYEQAKKLWEAVNRVPQPQNEG